MLREDPAISDEFIDNLTGFFINWRCSTQDWAGNWFGEGVIAHTPDVGLNYLRHLFQTILGKRIVITTGGVDYWEGQIVELTFDDLNSKNVRSMEQMTNAVKLFYTKVGDNEIVNSSVESGKWAITGSPDTNERTTDWSARGAYSQHIVAQTGNQGCQIEDGDSTGLAVTAGVGYDCSVIVKIVSGTWRLKVYRTDTDEELAVAITSDTGRQWLEASVSDQGDYTGAIEIRLTCSSGGGEVYADMAVFRSGGVKSETEWNVDADSIDTYGRIEAIMLEGEMTDTEADAVAQLAVAENAWPRSRGPGGGTTFTIDLWGVPTLTISCMGLGWTFGWTHIMEDLGTGGASTLLATVLDLSVYIASSNAFIDTNAAEVQMFVDDPTNIAELVEKIIAVGNGSGVQWMGGVYPGASYVYKARPTEVEYLIVDGKILTMAGAPVKPINFHPGWAVNTDLLYDQAPAGGTAQDDPQRVWLEETWIVWDGENVGVEWTEEDTSRFLT